MADNLNLYNKWRTAPENALKPITAGNLKGKSDINPQWRIQVLTETFGPDIYAERDWDLINGANAKVLALFSWD